MWYAFFLTSRLGASGHQALGGMPSATPWHQLFFFFFGWWWYDLMTFNWILTGFDRTSDFLRYFAETFNGDTMGIAMGWYHQWPWRSRTDWGRRYRFHRKKAYFLGLNFREYPHKIWPNIWYSSSILGSWNSHWTNMGIFHSYVELLEGIDLSRVVFSLETKELQKSSQTSTTTNINTNWTYTGHSYISWGNPCLPVKISLSTKPLRNITSANMPQNDGGDGPAPFVDRFLNGTPVVLLGGCFSHSPICSPALLKRTKCSDIMDIIPNPSGSTTLKHENTYESFIPIYLPFTFHSPNRKPINGSVQETILTGNHGLLPSIVGVSWNHHSGRRTSHPNRAQ